MAPTVITDDFYAVLEITQTATAIEISRSYKRLALSLHPDRNRGLNATEAFQLLAAAYETLKDKDKRRSYDFIYPRIAKATKPSPQSQPKPKPQPQTPRSPPSATQADQDDTNIANAAIAALLKSKEERSTRWLKAQKVYEDAIFELRREVRKLQRVVKDFEDKEKAEQVEDAAAKSWSTWAFSPLYGKSVATEEMKAEKIRERLGRLHSKGFKERDLAKNEKELEIQEELLRVRKEAFEDANRIDDAARSVIEERLRTKRQRQRLEKERAERAEKERVMKEQYERMQKEAERAQKERAELRAREAAKRKKRADAEEAARVARLARERAETSARFAAEMKRRAQTEADAMVARAAREKLELQARLAAELRRQEQVEAAAKAAKEQQKQREWQARLAAELKRREEVVREEFFEMLRKGGGIPEGFEAKVVSEKMKAGKKEQRHTSKPSQGHAANNPKPRNPDSSASRSTTATRPANFNSTCRHDTWWPKVEGRDMCEHCDTTYGYLLECPGCSIKACATCQQQMRPSRRARKSQA